MRPILAISIDSKRVENMLNGYIRDLPVAADISAKKIAGNYARFYLAQMKFAKGVGGGKPYIGSWTGESFSVLRAQIENPVKLGKGEYGVAVPQSLIMLDKMRAHYVSLRKGSKITRWARDHGVWSYTMGLGKMIVHPHPWLKQANIKAGKNVSKIAESEVNKMIGRRK